MRILYHFYIVKLHKCNQTPDVRPLQGPALDAKNVNVVGTKRFIHFFSQFRKLFLFL